MTRRGWLLFAAMSVIWGIPYLLIKIAVGEMSPATLVFARTALGALLLLPLAVSRGGTRRLLARWPRLLLYTFVEVAGPWYLLSDAERRLTSSLSGLLIAGVPLLSAALIWLFGGDERPDMRRVAGLIVGFGGVAVLVGLDVAAEDIGAVVEIGLVVLGYAVGPMIIARRLGDVPAAGVIVASLVLTAAAYAPLALIQLPAQSLSVQAILSVVILGAVCTALGFVLFFALVAEAGPNRSTVITYFNPAIAIVLGVVLLHEPFTIGIAIGFVLIALGSFLATRRSRPARAAEVAATPSG